MPAIELTNHTAVLALLTGMPGWGELIILGLLGVLIFGRRLPEVGKNIGRGIVEFKKGLQGIEEDVEQSSAPPRIEPKTDAHAQPTDARAAQPAGESGQTTP